MMRASNVIFGVLLILSLWAWMLLSIDTTVRTWWALYLLACKFSAACFITAPVYREYLR